MKKLQLAASADSLAVLFAWGIISAIALEAFAIGLLFVSAPFIGDKQEDSIKNFLPNPLFALVGCATAGWALALLRDRLYQQIERQEESRRIDAMLDDVQVSLDELKRHSEWFVEPAPLGEIIKLPTVEAQCRHCRYASSTAYLEPCALHPGREDRSPCIDFQEAL